MPEAFSDRGHGWRVRLAAGVARLLSRLLRMLGRGGTALPGKIAHAIAPGLLGQLLAPLAGRTVLVSGTNGKTTTARLVTALFESGGETVVSNSSGSNLVRGILTTLCNAADASGEIDADRVVLEVDEAVLPEVLGEVSPAAVVFTNLFRDQLDRYGEVNTVARRWREALEGLDELPLLVVNADDPSVASLARIAPDRAVVYGMELPEYLSAREPASLDAVLCAECGGALEFGGFYISHLSEWSCPECGLSRPEPQVRVSGLEELVVDRMRLTVESGGANARGELPLGGLYNAYNAAAVLALGEALGIEVEEALGRLERVRLAFGRQERVELHGHGLLTVLIKNPAGASESVRLVSKLEPDAVPLMIINDRTADGHDVSWLWDADFVPLDAYNDIVVAGLRGADMALRLEQEGIPTSSIHLCSSVGEGLDEALTLSGPGETVVALPNYTALFDLRSELVRRGAAGEFWKQ